MNEEFYYKETHEGVHLYNHLNCMEPGTLCGIGCDNPDLEETDKKVVTCRLCIYILKTLRRVKYKEHSCHSTV